MLADSISVEGEKGWDAKGLIIRWVDGFNDEPMAD
jgi:hypothetical protein